MKKYLLVLLGLLVLTTTTYSQEFMGHRTKRFFSDWRK